MSPVRLVFAVLLLFQASHALAIGKHNPNDPIYRVDPASVTDGRCNGNHAPEATWGARCHKWLDRARDVVKCIDQKEWAILHGKNLVPMCDAVSKVFTHTCHCGCFAPETRLLAVDTEAGEAEWIEVGDVQARAHSLELYTIHGDSTLGALRLETKRIAHTTTGVEAKPMVVITMQDGRALRLTEEHGVLLADGRMVAAGDVVATDALVTMSGEPAAIRTVERATPQSQRVFNVLTAAPNDAATSHLIIAEGFVVGDLAWQNSLARELDAVAIRN